MKPIISVGLTMAIFLIICDCFIFCVWYIRMVLKKLNSGQVSKKNYKAPRGTIHHLEFDKIP